MQAAWRLAINNLSARRSRTLLLSLAVAMACGLIAAVACAMSSLNAAFSERIVATVGAGDLRVRHVGVGTFDAGVLETVRGWPEVVLAAGRVREAVALRRDGGEAAAEEVQPITVWGIDPASEFAVRPVTLLEGRMPSAEGEIALDAAAGRTLKAVVGTRLLAERFGEEPVRLLVVGVTKVPPMGAIFENEEAAVTLATMGLLTGAPGRLTEIDLVLREGVEAEAFAKAQRGAGALPGNVILQPTEKVTSGLEKNIESNQVGFYIGSVLSFVAAAFIIMTGMTTGVTERTRELAVLRSIGATRRQLGMAQLVVGALLGLGGAVLGVPLGTLGAWVLVLMFPDQLPGGFVFSPLGAGLAVLGSVWAGLLGGVWPAVAAARTSPLEGLAARARPVRRRWVWACVFAGVALPGLQWAAMVLPRDSTMVFWSYVLFGLPVMMVGYFLLGVPVTALMGRVVSPVVSAALRLPRGLLGRTIAATPFRHGFTAASMMLGLALMVSIWTNGRAVLRDWLDAIALPDAFIYGHNFKAGVAERIRGRVPEVVNTCAITIQNLETGSSAAVKGLGTYKTSFVGFEPRPFFEMTRLAWVEMDGAQVARAKARLEEGGAVIVSREYAVTRKVGLGETVTVRFEGRTIPFEVVGIVASPGLDLVSKFLEIGDQYLDQSVNAICGSREDLKRHFGNDAVNFIQLNFREGADGKAALKAARAAVGPGVRFAVTAADMKAEIRGFISGSLMVMSVVGIGAMLVSCLGVANLIIAGVHARRFELGVLRAVGAGRGLLGRLVLGEAVVIAASACVLGTLLGLQGAWAGQQVNRITIGLVLGFSVPWGAVLLGWAAVAAVTVGAAAPTAVRLVRREPRELLAAGRG